MKKMPVLFVGHGSPMNIIENNRFTVQWRAIADDIPKPKSILCISAHWYEEENIVSKSKYPETIHDFYGFPEVLYAIPYPAPGAPELAVRVSELLSEIVFEQRGLDHGAWSVLNFMYPKADIPVCQLSLNAGLTPEQCYQAGKALQPLREEGVLIFGSGNIVHNLSILDWEMEKGYPWADTFDEYVKTSVLARNHDNIIHYSKAGPSAKNAFKTREHYAPLLYVLGAAQEDEKIRIYNDERVLGAISMTSYLFTANDP